MISNEQFDFVVERRLGLIKEILLRKRAEYAPNDCDRLYNFNRAAGMLRLPPEQCLVGMWTKHIVSILEICENILFKQPSAEMIEEKIGDAINYLILLEAMLKDRNAAQGRPVHGVQQAPAEKLPAATSGDPGAQ